MRAAAQKHFKDKSERQATSKPLFKYCTCVLALVDIFLRSSRTTDLLSDSGNVYEATKLDDGRAQHSRDFPVEESLN